MAWRNSTGNEGSRIEKKKNKCSLVEIDPFIAFRPSMSASLGIKPLGDVTFQKPRSTIECKNSFCTMLHFLPLARSWWYLQERRSRCMRFTLRFSSCVGEADSLEQDKGESGDGYGRLKGFAKADYIYLLICIFRLKYDIRQGICMKKRNRTSVARAIGGHDLKNPFHQACGFPKYRGRH